MRVLPASLAQPVEYFSHPDERTESIFAGTGSFFVERQIGKEFRITIVYAGICKPKKSSKMSNSKVIIGFLAGAIVGGALGILLAPDKGSETRRKIIEKGNDIGDSISEFGGTVKDKFNQVVNGAKGGINA
jgi:YtxH-like protein